jgi:hypothetical protein
MTALRAAAAVLAISVMAAACQGPPRARETPELLPPARPGRVDASAFETRWPLKHVVFVI